MMHDASTVEVPGPLGPLAPGFRLELEGLGYSQWTGYALLLLMADTSRWDGRPRNRVEELDTDCVDAFLKDRRDHGQVRRLTRRAQVPLLTFLRSVGVSTEPTRPAPHKPPDRLLAEFAGICPMSVAWPWPPSVAIGISRRCSLPRCRPSDGAPRVA
jgi:hypothetical protein